MKQFDPTKPYCRRDGKPAKIVHTYISGLRAGQRLVVTEDDYYCTHNNGRCYSSDESERDLINIPEKIEGWIGITKYMVCPTLEAARIRAVASNRSYDAFIHVSLTEGEGLDD